MRRIRGEAWSKAALTPNHPHAQDDGQQQQIQQSDKPQTSQLGTF
jgi:hypothetical protein